MAQSELYITTENMEWSDLGNGIKRIILGYTPEMMMTKVSFETGAIGEMHSHPHVQSTYIESGKFKVLIGTEVMLLHKGDAFIVPRDLIHGVECVEAGTLIDAFTPMREDFLSSHANEANE